MLHKDFGLEIKAVDDSGTIEGVAASYGNLDHGGDIIAPGAIAASLNGRKSIPMLLFHDQSKPVGAWTEFKDMPDGLLVRGKFAMKSASGREAHAMASDGAFGGLSVGYRTKRHKFEGKARILQEIALHEISLVSIPMNDRTEIFDVKSILEGGELPTLPEFEKFLREAGGFSKTQATAIAGKGLASLLRGEPGNTETGDLLDAIAKRLRA